MNYKLALENFLKSGKEFSLVYKSSAPLVSVSRILILDSSFNPPHMAHLTLAKEAISHDFKDGKNGEISSGPQKMLLLLLAVKNADKIVPVPALFEHRLQMMQLMANSLEKLKIPVSIGLTTHARFAEKSSAIQNFINADSLWVNLSTKLTFLLGYDTLIRVLDPKYYAPASLEDSLNNFMTKTDLFCLTRAENGDQFTKQQNYIQGIANGEFPEIPRLWANYIHMKTVSESRDTIGGISSSGIRAAYLSNTHPQNLPLLKEIDAYIQSNGLYSDANK